MEEGYSFYAGVEEVLHPVKPSGWLRLTSLNSEAEVLTFFGLPGQLHAGEASCLSIAEHRRWLFLTDDKAARRQAARHGVAVSGTLGCLVLGVDLGLWSLDYANPLLAGMIGAGFYSPVKDLAILLK